MDKLKKAINNIWGKIATWIISLGLIRILISAGIVVLLGVYGTFAERLHFLSGNKPTWIGVVVIVSSIVWLALVEGAMRYEDKHDPKDDLIEELKKKQALSDDQIECLKKNNKEIIDELEKYKLGYSLFDNILAETRNLCNNKNGIQLRMMHSISSGVCRPVRIYSRPYDQMKLIIQSLGKVFREAISSDDFVFTDKNCYFSLAYTFNNKDQMSWHWAESNTEQGLTLEKLIKSESAIAYLINHNEVYLFENDKRYAMKNHRYIPDPKEVYIDGEPYGSIACYKIELKRDDVVYCTAVLSISTYGIKFVDYPDTTPELIEDTKDNILYSILVEFEARIRVELGNYCIMNMEPKRKDPFSFERFLRRSNGERLD